MKNKKIVVSNLGQGILFVEGTESNLLVIAFAGVGNGLMMNPSDFFNVTGLIKYHHIFLQDSFRLWYQNGINHKFCNFQQLCGYFEDKIKVLNVEKVLVIGISSGGHAALLAAHCLKADYAHAFSPQTNIGLSSLFETSTKSYILRLNRIRLLYQKQWRNWKDFDLRNALLAYNGKTSYYIHYGADNRYDSERAQHMENVPGMKLFGYPYKNHAIVEPMRKDGYLENMFLPKHIEDPQQLYDSYYDNDFQKTQATETKVPSNQKIAEIIQKIALSSPSYASIYGAKDLPGELGLDSVACLEIVITLENVFGINIALDVMEAEDLKTVDSILHLINRSK